MLAAPMVPLAPMMAGLNQFGWRAGGNYELMAVQMVAAKALKIADELAEKTIDWLAEKLAGRSWLSLWLLRWLLCRDDSCAVGLIVG